MSPSSFPYGYVDVPLGEGEQEIFRQTASYMRGGVPLVGGEVVVTNRRVVFRPIGVDTMPVLRDLGLPFLDGGFVLLGRFASTTSREEPQAAASDGGIAEHDRVISVKSQRNASLLRPTKPPSLVLDTESYSVELGVLHSPTSPNFSLANNAARDNAISAMREVMRGNV